MNGSNNSMVTATHTTEVQCDERYTITISGAQADWLIELITEKHITPVVKSDALLHIAARLNEKRRVMPQGDIERMYS